MSNEGGGGMETSYTGVDGYISVEIVGDIESSELRYTKAGAPFTKGKIAIPFSGKGGVQMHKFFNFIVWEEGLAEAVAEISVGTRMKFFGSIRVSSYDTKCKSCGNAHKAYWTDITVTDIDLG